MADSISVPEDTKQLSAQERLRLFQTLGALMQSQFNALVFALKPPQGILPGDSDAQGNRCKVLLEWAEGPGGPGLSVLERILEEIITSGPISQSRARKLSAFEADTHEVSSLSRVANVRSSSELPEHIDAPETRTQLTAFVISGKTSSSTMAEIQAIVELLRKKTGDCTLDVAFYKEGSIKIILYGSEEGLESLQELFDSGILSEIHGADVEAVVQIKSNEADARKARLIQALKIRQKPKDKLQVLDLREADLRNSNLRNIDFSKVNLEGANLIGADLTDSDFSTADIDGAIFGDNLGLDELLKKLLRERGGIFKEDISVILRQQFHGLQKRDVDWMCEVGFRKKLSPGAVLIREQEPIDFLYVVLSGIFEIFTKSGKNYSRSRLPSKEVKVSTVNSGIVGEMSFIRSDVYLPSATVRADEESLVWSISKSDLREKIEQDPGFGSRFYQVLGAILADRLESTKKLLKANKQVRYKRLRRSQSIFKLHEVRAELEETVSSLPNMSPGMLLIMSDFSPG